MKLNSRLLLVLLLAFITGRLSAQNASIEDYKGIYDLKIGESFDKVKSLLEDKAMPNYYSRKEIEEIKKTGEKVNDEDYEKNTYRVKPSQKQYFTYMDVKAKSIEVSFDKDKKIKQIIMFFPKTHSNEVLLRGASSAKFGETMCAEGMGETPTFYCPWEKDSYRYFVYDFDGVGEVTINEYIYVKFAMEGNEY